MKLAQKILDAANGEFEQRNYKGYTARIIELYSHLGCNCFFKNQDQEIFAEQKEIIDSTDFDTPDWDENFAKGFIYLRNKEDMLAYHYFTVALEIKEHPLLYSLRSVIDSTHNSNKIEDSDRAIAMDPSARNYFLRAGLCEKSNSLETIERSIEYLNKAISIDPDFACAYNNRASSYALNKDYKNVIEDLKKCVLLQPDHWAYDSLIKYLLQENEPSEALYYTDLAIKHSEDFEKYILKKAEILVTNHKFDDALNHLDYFHDKYPQNFKIEYEIEKIKKQQIEDLLTQAKSYFSNKEYTKASLFFQLYVDNRKPLDEKEVRSFLLSQIKSRKPEFSVDDEVEKMRNSFKDIPKEYQSYDVLNFGKYKGKKLSEIKIEDPDYLLWCTVNLQHFALPNTWFLQPDVREQKLFFDALERNCVKQEIIPPKPKYSNYSYSDSYEENSLNSPYYNDSLDMDQQSPEFWDSI